MIKPHIRKPYDRVRQVAGIPSDSKTITDAGNETDINNIVARFKRTGEMPQGQTQQPQFADVTEMQGDLTELIEKGRKAQAALDKVQLDNTIAATKKAEENAKKLAEYEKILAKQQENQEPTAQQKDSLTE